MKYIKQSLVGMCKVNEDICVGDKLIRKNKKILRLKPFGIALTSAKKRWLCGSKIW